MPITVTKWPALPPEFIYTISGLTRHQYEVILTALHNLKGSNAYRSSTCYTAEKLWLVLPAATFVKEDPQS